MKARALTTIAILSGAVLAACDSSSSTRPQLAPAEQSSRIVFGTVDGNAHPAVGLIVMDVGGEPTFRCSGTFLSPTVFLTAGHCVGEPGEFSGMRVFTQSDVEHGNNNYPFAGPNTIEASSWHAHPLFTEAGFPLHDVGVVVLSAPFNLPANQYGVLPAVNQLDALHNGANTIFTSVGYGTQKSNPAQETALLIRESAQPHLVSINTPQVGHILMILSNNASDRRYVLWRLGRTELPGHEQRHRGAHIVRQESHVRREWRCVSSRSAGCDRFRQRVSQVGFGAIKKAPLRNGADYVGARPSKGEGAERPERRTCQTAFGSRAFRDVRHLRRVRCAVRYAVSQLRPSAAWLDPSLRDTFARPIATNPDTNS